MRILRFVSLLLLLRCAAVKIKSSSFSNLEHTYEQRKKHEKNKTEIKRKKKEEN
jgi:hypothetical protein